MIKCQLRRGGVHGAAAPTRGRTCARPPAASLSLLDWRNMKNRKCMFLVPRGMLAYSRERSKKVLVEYLWPLMVFVVRDSMFGFTKEGVQQ